MRLAVAAALASAALLTTTASTALAGPPSRTPPIGAPSFDDDPPPVGASPIDYTTPRARARGAVEVKSESTATILAVGSTLGGLALISAGAERGNDHVIVTGIAMTLIGPSAGHFYAGETGHAVKMSLLRTGGALVLGMGFVASFTSESSSGDIAGAPCRSTDGTCTNTPSHHEDNRTPERMMWLGGGVLVAAALYDLWDAHNAARRTNEKAQRSWAVAPSMMNGGGGFSVAGSF